MQNTLLILLVAIILLWMAVTDKLSTAIDAWDVLIGNKQVCDGSSSSAVVNTLTSNLPKFTLPSLPKIGNNAQVPAV